MLVPLSVNGKVAAIMFVFLVNLFHVLSANGKIVVVDIMGLGKKLVQCGLQALLCVRGMVAGGGGRNFFQSVFAGIFQALQRA